MFRKSFRAFLAGLTLLVSTSIGTAQEEGWCARLTLDKDIYYPGETSVLALYAQPGLVPFVYVSLDPAPIWSSPYRPRRFPTISEDGYLVIKAVELSCDIPDKYIQIALYDPYTRKFVCASNEVYLEIDRSRCVEQAAGCTPGYWKQDHHFDSWPEHLSPDMNFSDIFVDAFPGMTLVEVLKQGGGGLKALGRHTVAALLNSSSGIDYPESEASVVTLFNDAMGEGDDYYEGLKDYFADMNEAGCPLN